jgi:hypothetical protein
LERRLAQLEFTTDRSEYVEGDSLTLRLTNHSPVEVSYGLCGPVLEVHSGGVWMEVSALGSGICGGPGYVLLPGSSVESSRQLPRSLPTGTYRLVTFVVIAGEDRGVDLSSTSFTVH